MQANYIFFVNYIINYYLFIWGVKIGTYNFLMLSDKEICILALFKGLSFTSGVLSIDRVEITKKIMECDGFFSSYS